MLDVVDIITTEGLGITVWARHLPPEEYLENSGPIPFLDLVYPGIIPTVNAAIAWAKGQLGDFTVKSAG